MLPLTSGEVELLGQRVDGRSSREIARAGLSRTFQHVREIFTIVEALRASGVSILLVEQNARAALRVADHGYVLETGEFGLSGAADPRVIETYLGAGRKD